MRQTASLVLTQSWLNALMHGGGSGFRLNDGFDVKLFFFIINSWLKFDDCLWLDPPCFN